MLCNGWLVGVLRHVALGDQDRTVEQSWRLGEGMRLRRGQGQGASEVLVFPCLCAPLNQHTRRKEHCAEKERAHSVADTTNPSRGPGDRLKQTRLRKTDLHAACKVAAMPVGEMVRERPQNVLTRDLPREVKANCQIES